MLKQVDSTKDNNVKTEEIINKAFKAVIDNTKDMVFVKDINLNYVEASEAFVKMVGKESANEIIGYNDTQIFEDINLAKKYIEDDKKLLLKGENLVNYIEPITDKDGQHRYGTTSKYILKNDEGNQIGILGFTHDITRDYLTRQHYQQELKYLFELPKNTYSVSYIDVDSWRIISQRRQFSAYNAFKTCYTVEDFCELELNAIVDNGSKAFEFYSNFNKENIKQIFESGRSDLDFEYQRRFSKDNLRWIHNEIKFLTDAESGHLCVMLTAKDIDDIKSEEKRLIEAAKMDKMTNLYNRETTMNFIELTLLENAQDMHVLFMIDVDNFKSLNDTMGHKVGDEFLIALAYQLKHNFRDSDIVGRIGGDEFFALMKNVSSKKVVENKVKDLLDAINMICSKYPSVNLSASIGIAIYPNNAKTLDELYAKADEALYEAKKRGKGQAVFV